MTRFKLTSALASVLSALSVGSTSAGLMYPIAPYPSTVSLEKSSFIQYVPLQSPNLTPLPYPVDGDKYGNHLGFLPDGSFFIGVFGGIIDTSQPD